MSVAIIGAGAAGYFAAIALAEKQPDAEISLFEATGKTLSKLIISGGGRCNVTTSTTGARELSAFYPRGSRELLGPFNRFESGDTVRWFESRGVPLLREPDGRMFPSTHKSITVANCLREEAKKLGVALKVQMPIAKIKKNESTGVFELVVKKSKERIAVTHVLIATGGSRGGFTLAENLGHQIEPPVPSLFSFEIRDRLLEELQGVSFESTELRLECLNGETFYEQGPVLVTHWGLSGPAIIRLSARAARALAEGEYNAKLFINFLPDHNTESVQQIFREWKEKHPRRTVSLHSPFDLPKSFWQQVLEGGGVALSSKNYSDLSKQDMNSLAQTLTAKAFEVTGKGRFKDEFVTCGGVRLSEVNFKTMESKICPGLYFAGEVLDIDGLTGGYNFQCAWTTGWLAAGGIAESLSTGIATTS